MEKLISVIIPVYNREKTVVEAINSVLNQTYRNLEVIVVDDGSADRSAELIKQIDDDRVIYIYQQNAGACAARNNGIRHAKGDYIAFHDSDDIWLENKLERQLAYLEKGGFDFVFCALECTSGKKVQVIPQSFDEKGDILRAQLCHNVMSTQTFFMKREVCDNVEFDISFKRLQDWDFSLQVILSGYKLGFCPEVLVKSDVQADSITRRIKTSEAFEHLYGKYKEYYAKYPDALSNMYRMLAFGYKNEDRKKSKSFFKAALKLKFNKKLFIQYILYSLHLY